QNPASGLMPAAGEFSRYRAQQWLAFIASELHKSFGPFFKPGVSDEAKDAMREFLARRLGFVDKALEGRTYLTGETFTAADAYLWVVLRWTVFAKVDLSAFANIQKFNAAVSARPAVAKTLQEEGLA